MNKNLSTQSYKGVRDFYPEDMAVQQYLFDIWARTAESFGFQRYDASVLEPAELYRAKGAENEEMVTEQTYTFTDRGDREVTLRPEMTPTVARMIAGRAKELAWPVRWYSIPNLFRYERAQRGRLREHWQLNCDIFGTEDIATDVEIIALAYQIFMNFGASDEMFTIHVNDRQLMHQLYTSLGLTDEQIAALTRLNDRRDKMAVDAYRLELDGITGDETISEEVVMLLDKSDDQTDVVVGLAELGITNVVFDKSLARGFDYYTGTIFEFKDTAPENKRSLLGGGRYDNLTTLFGGEPVPGVGFGFGDVSLRDFLETHDLLPQPITSPTVIVAPMGTEHNLSAQQIAQVLRTSGVSVAVDSSSRKVGKKLSVAADTLSTYAVVVGKDEIARNEYTLKNLVDHGTTTGTLEDLVAFLVGHD
ncbi:MAG TPA: histidine--tRNA ligase [Candidatus Paceibacterota bacterium]|nr:histidine--tRNA ligase [Candidatus Paceibacterota bacterium]